MLFGFYKLFYACLKYNFSFILDSKGFWRGEIKMTLYPYNAAHHIVKDEERTIMANGYKKLFRKAIKEMERYRERNGS